MGLDHKNYTELQELNNKVQKIFEVDDEQLSWSDKFDLIFSDDISAKVSFEYYDPDMDYEDDVRAWVEGFDRFFQKQTRIHNVLNDD